ncbi:MAG: 2-aminoethylphosphonate--pyruvate transaminase [Deferribacterales bacterium]
MHKFDNNYLLLTPGPLTTTKTVKEAMAFDVPTRDKGYSEMVQEIRAELATLASASDEYTAVLVQGSGTFAVEAMITGAVGRDQKLLIAVNGAYGERMADIAKMAGIPHETVTFDEDEAVEPEAVRAKLSEGGFTHFAVIHLETTTGILNPVEELGKICAGLGVVFLADCMSSFGSIPFDMKESGIHFLAASSNKCLQGVPGIGFVIFRKDMAESCRGKGQSLSLNLYEQYRFMEDSGGGFRFTSPTHVILGFAQALRELRDEGGVASRNRRYADSQKTLSDGMQELGFELFLEKGVQSPVITTFIKPDGLDFEKMYSFLRDNGFYIYPGKLTKKQTFRIGTIGNVFPQDIRRLLLLISDYLES